MRFCFSFSRSNASKNERFPEPALATNAHFANSILFGKTKALFGKDTTRKKNGVFAYVNVICGKRKRNQLTKIGGLMFFYEVEGHMQKLSLFGQVKKNMA